MKRIFGLILITCLWLAFRPSSASAIESIYACIAKGTSEQACRKNYPGSENARWYYGMVYFECKQMGGEEQHCIEVGGTADSDHDTAMAHPVKKISVDEAYAKFKTAQSELKICYQNGGTVQNKQCIKEEVNNRNAAMIFSRAFNTR